MSDPAASTVTIEELLAQGRWLRRLAVSLVHDEDAAEELAQAGLVQALTHPPRHGGNLRAWFAVVLRNLARHQGTTARREREERTAAAELREDAQESGEQIVMRIETQQLVGEALLQLDPRHRDVLVLRYYDELSYREIAARLKLPQATVRSRTERALQELRKRLDLLGGESAIDWRLGIAAWIASTGLPRGKSAATASTVAVWAGALAVVGVLTGVATLSVWRPWAAPAALEPDAGAAGSTPVANGSADATPDATARSAALSAVGSADRAPRVRLTGAVARGDDGRAVAGAAVRYTLDSRDGSAWTWGTTTDADGAFVIEGPGARQGVRTTDLLATERRGGALRIEGTPGLANFEEFLVEYDAFGGGDLDVSGRRGDVGTVLLSPAYPMDVALEGEWGERGGVWLAVLSRNVHGIERLRQVGEWSDDRTITWLDALGARLSDDRIVALVAFDGARLAAIELDLPMSDASPRTFTLRASAARTAVVRVVDDAGEPLVGFEVHATPLYWPLRVAGATGYCEHVTIDRPTGLAKITVASTDADGVARFDSLPAPTASRAHFALDGRGDYAFGTYVFCVSGRLDDGTWHRSVSRPVLLADAETEVVLRFAPDVPTPLTGTVVDEHGAPLPGVAVTRSDQTHSSFAAPSQGTRTTEQVKTDAQGRFVFEDVDRAGQGREYLRVVGTDVGYETRHFLVDVPTGDEPGPELVLRRASHLRGFLVDEEGDPFGVSAGALELRAYALDAAPGDALGGPLSRIPIDSDGSFSVKDLPAGRLLLVPQRFEFHGLFPFEALAVDPRDGEVVLPVERFGASTTDVSIEVVSPTGGGAVLMRRAVAFLDGAGERGPFALDAVIADDGRTARWDALPPGSWQVHVVRDGGRSEWLTVELDGALPEVNLSLPLGTPGSLVGSLGEGASASELAGAEVVVRRVGPGRVELGPDAERELGSLVTKVEIGTAGSFRLDGLAPGEYEVCLLGGSVVARSVVGVDASEETRVTLEPHSARRLSWIGDPAPYLELGHRFVLTLTDDQGRSYPWPVHVDPAGELYALVPADAAHCLASWWSESPHRYVRAVRIGAKSAAALGAGPTVLALPD